MYSAQLGWFALVPESLVWWTLILIVSEKHKPCEEIFGFFLVPTNIILSGLSWGRRWYSRGSLCFLNNFWAQNLRTGDWFKAQVITGRPHLHAEKMPTAFPRLAYSQHVFTDFIHCLQLCFDCTHCIPKLSCRRGLHRTCCSIGASF